VGSAIWSILRKAASRGPSALADILVYFYAQRADILEVVVMSIYPNYVYQNIFTFDDLLRELLKNKTQTFVRHSVYKISFYIFGIYIR